MKFSKKFNFQTYMKYFLSYFIIFAILILGFFFIVKYQLSKSYFKQLTVQSNIQLDDLTSQLTDDLVFLSQTDSSIESNIHLITSRDSTSGWQLYQACQELLKYDSTNQLIKSICFFNKNTNICLTTQTSFVYLDNVFHIIVNDTKKSLVFNPEPYFDVSCSQLILISNDISQYLIYFPAQTSTKSYVYFYILDTTQIQMRMKNLISDSITAIALIDPDNHIATGVNSLQLMPHMESFVGEDGIHEIDSTTSICVNSGISSGFSLMFLISNKSLNHQLANAFTKSYLTLFSLGCAGFFLIFFVMKFTYVPLHKLTKKIATNSSSDPDYLKQLDNAFSNVVEQNQLLKLKLENYQLSIKKSLLDTTISLNYSDFQATLPDIDPFFDTKSTREIFAVQIKSFDDQNPFRIQKYLQEKLPRDSSCIILKKEVNSTLFLINYTGTESNKDEVLKELLNVLHIKHGLLSAISDSADSPMDIPSLCEHAIHASSYWSKIPVVDYKSLPSVTTSFAYPHDMLNQLTEQLNGNHFSTARNILKDILQIIYHSIQEAPPLSEFFTRSILIDLITIIISCMSQANIAFKSYGDIFYETLYLCRSYPYIEKMEAIAANIQELLDIGERNAGTYITSTQIKQLINESYCQPNFSIYELADNLGISVTYASKLIKKELNQNFSDYVWTLRFKKAIELLKQTDMTIDEISIAIGYINTSSFRRKFKVETGLTPSQFRT